MIYELIGRFIVRLIWRFYGREIKIGLGVAALGIAIGGYLAATRDVPEG
jgi:hypothetical protein